MKKPAATAAERLEGARTAHAETSSRVKELEAARTAALMADNDRKVDRLDSELGRLRKAARVHAEKIGLLKDQVARERREERDRETEAKIKEIEGKFLAREAIGSEISDLIVRLNKRFLELQALNRDIDASWQWNGADRHGLLLPREEIVAAIQYEIFRSTCVPKKLGGQTEALDVGVFPGSKPPRLELMQLPQAVTPLTTVLTQTSAFASDVMRGRQSAPTPAAPAQQKSGALELPSSDTFTPTGLSTLLERQNELAALDNPSPSQEAEYGEVIKQIAMLQTETLANV
jgi:hypothetical protein